MALAGPASAATNHTCDIAIIGGGVGGVAAAIAALKKNRTVVLTEETSMVGGQFSSQLVPADEHYWIEPSKGAYGQSGQYKALRKAVRDSYKRYRPVTQAFKNSNEPNPGNAWVSRIAAEPMVWRNRMMDVLQPYVNSGKLKILYKTTPTSAVVSGQNVTTVTVETPSGPSTISARYFIDATELGDLLPIVGANYTVGAEANTNELHNDATTPNPGNQQSITWVAALGYNRKNPGDYRTAAPPNYEQHRPDFDAFFADNLFDPTRDWSWDDGPNFWQYRRVVAQSNFTVDVEEVTLLNYPCNDYKGGALLNVSAADRQAHLDEAKNLTACLIHYLQNHIPRKDGCGQGYPGLRLRPDISETPDGYAAHPYIREARRMVSIGRVWEWHVGVKARPNNDRAAQFNDSVGTGHYWLDIHAGPEFEGGLWEECYTYQIPFMALISNNRKNVLPGGKNLGVSHVVNGAYRLHPTEWAVGEAAGLAAHTCIAWGLTPEQLRSQRMADFQGVLRRYGSVLEWPDSLQTKWKD